MEARCKRFFAEMLRSVVIFPLTAGNLTKKNGRHDGRIATIVFVGCSFAITAVIMLFNFRQPFTAVTFDMVYFIISIFDVLALVSMVIICVVSRGRNSRWLSDDPVLHHELYLKIRFLWLLGLLCISSSSMKFVRNIHCWANHDYTDKGDVIKGLYWNVSTVLYIFMQLGFVSYFSKFKFRGSLGIHYGMILMVTSNMLVWLYSFLHDSEHLFNPGTKHSTTGNNSFIRFCNGNSSLNNLLDTLHPYMSPAYIEYALLAVSCFLGMWSSTDNENCENMNLQNTAAYEPIGEESRSLLDVTGNGVISTTRRNNRSVSYYISLICGILLILPLIIGSLFLVIDLDGNNDIYFPFEIYKILYSFILLLLNMVAFHKLRKECEFEKVLNTLGGSQIVLLCSGFADIIYRTFGLLAGVFDKEKAGCAVIVFNALNIFIDYLQTTFILQAHRYKKNRTSSSFFSIVNICLLMTLLNFGSWIVESLAAIHFDNISAVEVHYYNSTFWYHVVHIVGPVAIFYRFHSFIDFHILYRYFKMD